MEHDIRAAELFCSGYNCAQAVAVAFCDVTGLSPEFSAQAVSGFGGGFGRLREVCGAVSGMNFVISNLYGYCSPDPERQLALYAIVQKLLGQFKEQTGTLICRELLNNPPTDPKPSPRTQEYYAQRPCARFVALCGKLLDEYISENPPKNSKGTGDTYVHG